MSDVADDAQVIQAHHERLMYDQYARARDETEQWLEDGVVYCVDCGIEIPPARLLVLPAAARCVDCQELWEYERVR